MYEQILTDFLDYILYKKWSIIRALQYIEPKTELSSETIKMSCIRYYEVLAKKPMQTTPEVSHKDKTLYNQYTQCRLEEATASADVEEATATAELVYLKRKYSHPHESKIKKTRDNALNPFIESSKEHALDEDIICESEFLSELTSVEKNGRKLRILGTWFVSRIVKFISEIVPQDIRNLLEKYIESIKNSFTGLNIDINQAAMTISSGFKMYTLHSSNLYQSIYDSVTCFHIPNFFYNQEVSEFAYRDRIVNRLLDDIFLELIPMIYMQTKFRPQKSERPFKNTNQRRAIGWSHALTLFIKITGLEFRVGCDIACDEHVPETKSEAEKWRPSKNFKRFNSASISSAEEKLNQAQQELDNLKNQVASIRVICFHTSLEITKWNNLNY
ncbi:hypothetical protein F8M41_018787 [Gigaspora margarita]|uniref:Uncharacterized protein n=1 Tax=Gigaspora margarita TaxID=4874 RepID=A0A8H4AL24_GIGMA|nr:hypothetical protein F8M41_018787 [Gigaspora margarita]